MSSVRQQAGISRLTCHGLRRSFSLLDEAAGASAGAIAQIMGHQPSATAEGYQCRPAAKPASYDIKYPGTYNARRDSLEGFWRGQFGHTHGLMVVNAFYEHVSRPVESRTGQGTENVILEFRPRPVQDMLVACLWSRWTGGGEPDLDSYAAITDEPPEEVAAAGHDRCIISIKPENIDAWLNPDPSNLAALYAILDDRQRPYYEHRLAA